MLVAVAPGHEGSGGLADSMPVMDAGGHKMMPRVGADGFVGVLEEMVRLHQAKQAEYGGSYYLAAHLLGRPVLEILLGRMADKLARACNLTRQPGYTGAVRGLD